MLGNSQAPGYPIVYCSDGFCELTGFTRAQVCIQSTGIKPLVRTIINRDSESCNNQTLGTVALSWTQACRQAAAVCISILLQLTSHMSDVVFRK